MLSCCWRTVQGVFNRWIIVYLSLLASQVLCDVEHSSSDFPLPPQFPNLLFAFRESLSVSEELVQLANGIGSDAAINCGCRVSASMDSKGYPVIYSHDNLSMLSCSDQYLLIGKDGLELNTTEEPESAEQKEQKASLTTGLSIGLFTLLGALIVVVAIVRRRLCSAIAHLRGRLRNPPAIQRQRSDCQEMMSKEFQCQTNDSCCSSPDVQSSNSSVTQCWNLCKTNSSSFTSTDNNLTLPSPTGDRPSLLHYLHGSFGYNTKCTPHVVVKTEKKAPTISINTRENNQRSLPPPLPPPLDDVTYNNETFGGSNRFTPVASSRF